MIHSAGLAKPPTIYRPSIIVGDAATGHTTTFHGFYTPIQVAWWLAKAGVLNSGVDNWFLSQLGLTGQERKNIVPVDWVSRAILHLLLQPAAHGRTYHLACENPPTATDLAEAIGDVLKPRFSGSTPQAGGNAESSNGMGELMEAGDFRKHMDVYRAYFRDHPEFDTTNLRMFASAVPCPRVDRAMLARTGSYALDANFGWPRVQPPLAPLDVPSLLPRRAIQNTASKLLLLEITGVGGGAFTLALESPNQLQPGRTANPAATIRMRSDTFAALVAGKMTLETALRNGRVFLAAEPSMVVAAQTLLQAIVSAAAEKSDLSESPQPLSGRPLGAEAIRIRANLGETPK